MSKLAVIAFASAMSAVVVGAAHAGAGDDDEKELRRVEAALCEAFRTGDAAVIAKIEDERYTLTSSRGQVTDRESDIAEAKKDDPHYTEFRNHEQKIRFYGDAAIINGITSVKGTSGGKPFEGDFQFTDTWVKRDGEWKLAASHATRLGSARK